MRAMLLAAGLGKRLRPLTDHVAKPALTLNQRPLIHYNLDVLCALGVDYVVINTHYLPASIERAVETYPKRKQLAVCFSHEPELLGGAGGLNQAASHFKNEDYFWILNADSFLELKHCTWPELGGRIQQQHLNSAAVMTALTTTHPGLGFGAIFTSDQGRVLNISKDLNACPAAYRREHFSGLLLAARPLLGFLPAAPSDIFYDVMLPRLSSERFFSFYDAHLVTFETGNPTDFERLEKHLKATAFSR